VLASGVESEQPEAIFAEAFEEEEVERIAAHLAIPTRHSVLIPALWLPSKTVCFGCFGSVLPAVFVSFVHSDGVLFEAYDHWSFVATAVDLNLLGLLLHSDGDFARGDDYQPLVGQTYWVHPVS
jgi:hypothetical protein